MGLGQNRDDELDALHDWRNREYRAGRFSTADDVDKAIALVKPFQADMAVWFANQHALLMKRGMGGADTS
jgi:hypothetical protein